MGLPECLCYFSAAGRPGQSLCSPAGYVIFKEKGRAKTEQNAPRVTPPLCLILLLLTFSPHLRYTSSHPLPVRSKQQGSLLSVTWQHPTSMFWRKASPCGRHQCLQGRCPLGPGAQGLQGDIYFSLSRALGLGHRLSCCWCVKGWTSAVGGPGRHRAQEVPPEHLRGSHLPVHLGFPKQKGLLGRLLHRNSTPLPCWVEGMVLLLKTGRPERVVLLITERPPSHGKPR